MENESHITYSRMHNKWYVWRKPNDPEAAVFATEYLHSDGIWRPSTVNEHGKYTGYHDTKQAAEDCLNGKGPTMTHDPNQQFVVTTMSREDIANELNGHLDDTEAITSDRLKPDDKRLTDKICTDFAEALGNLMDQEDMLPACDAGEKYNDLNMKYLRMMGIDPTVCD